VAATWERVAACGAGWEEGERPMEEGAGAWDLREEGIARATDMTKKNERRLVDCERDSDQW